MCLVIAIVTFIYLLISLVETVIGLQKIHTLSDNEPMLTSPPLISLIITARNEEKTIHQTLTKIIEQTYVNLEIICVDDRSQDKTLHIIKQFARKDNRIKVIHIEHLPPGWMGKNYASYHAAKRASSEWILFIDADVLLESSAIERTITYACKNNLDHLTVFARFYCKGFLHNIFHLVLMGHGYVIPLKPWLAKQKHSKKIY